MVYFRECPCTRLITDIGDNGYPTPLARYDEGLLYSDKYEVPYFSGTRWFMTTLFTRRLRDVGFRQSLEG
jgi:hypothetical protein